MAQITLTPEDDLSKIEEIALLEKIVANLHAGSYLRLMLNDQLVDWLKHQIHEDAGCDVYLNWQETEARISDMRRELENVKASLEYAKQAGEDYRKQIEALRTEVQAGKDHIQALQWKVQEVEENREFIRETKDAQINALKVEVYDLLHAKK